MKPPRRVTFRLSGIVGDWLWWLAFVVLFGLIVSLGFVEQCSKENVG